MYIGLYSVQSALYTQSLRILIGSSGSIQEGEQISENSHIIQIPNTGFLPFLSVVLNVCLPCLSNKIQMFFRWRSHNLLSSPCHNNLIQKHKDTNTVCHITHHRIGVAKPLTIPISNSGASGGWFTSSEYWLWDCKSGRVSFVIFPELEIIVVEIGINIQVSWITCYCYKYLNQENAQCHSLEIANNLLSWGFSPTFQVFSLKKM